MAVPIPSTFENRPLRERLLGLKEGDVISWPIACQQRWKELEDLKPYARQRFRNIMLVLADALFFERIGSGKYRRTSRPADQATVGPLTPAVRRAREVFKQLGRPDLILEACVPAYVFGATFTVFGGAGYVLPTAYFLTVGVKEGGKGEVEWLSRDTWRSKRGGGYEFVKLIAKGQTEMQQRLRQLLPDCRPFQSWEELEGLLDALTHFDYTFALDDGARCGLSAAGSISAILATVAFASYRGRASTLPLEVDLSECRTVTAWDVGVPEESTSFSLLWPRHADVWERRKIFRKYVRLCQLLERVWNTNNESRSSDLRKLWDDAYEDLVGKDANVPTIKLLDYSSAAASLCATAGLPVLAKLQGKGDLAGHVNLDESNLYPKLPEEAPAGLLLNFAGRPEETSKVIDETVKRYLNLILFAPRESAWLLRHVIDTSSIATTVAARLLSSKVLPSEGLKILQACMNVQRGLYMQMATLSKDFHTVYPWAEHFKIEISPIGVGSAGTFLVSFPCVERVEPMLQSLRKHLRKGQLSGFPSSVPLNLRIGAGTESIFKINPGGLHGVPLSLYRVDEGFRKGT
jgi:hypothetical protein